MSHQIPHQSDAQLLAAFTAGNRDAFRALADRYVSLIYATAKRQASPHLAEDITQAVFILLAERAHTLRNPELLPAWLLRVTHFCAADARRADQRRRKHEQKAAVMASTTSKSTPPAETADLEPHLDAALQSLSASDRTALLLRYYNDQPLAQIALSLNTTEDAAKKRIARALEKLRKHFLRKNLTLALPLLATTIAKQATAAPPTLAAYITNAALTKTATSTSAALIAKGAAKLMAHITAKLAAASTLALLVITIGATTLIRQHQPLHTIAALPAPTASLSPTITLTPSTRIVPHDPILTIEVRDLNTDAPLPGVHLQLVSDLTFHDIGNSGMTDSAGKAAIPYPPTTGWGGEVIANAPGYVPVRSAWGPRALPSDPAPDHLAIRLEKAVTIGGRVVDSDGNPLAGATVLPALNKRFSLYTSEWNSATATTDANGRWSLAVAPENGTVWVGASHPLCLDDLGQIRTAPALFSELRNHTHVLRLRRGFPVSGTVFGPDGKPCRASISVGRYTGTIQTVPDIQTTDEGHFEFAAKVDMPLILTTHAAGFAIDTTSLTLGAAALHIDIHLTPQNPLAIHIVDPQNKPIPNALVSITYWTTNSDPNYQPQTFPVALLSDKNGNATWSDAPAQPVAAIIAAPGCLSRKDVPLDRNILNQITLLPRPIIHVRAFSAETGHLVTDYWPDGANASALSDGSYQLSEYWQMDKPFTFALAGDHYVPTDLPPRAFDGNDYDITVPLKEGERITGQLFNSEGDPLPNTAVSLQNKDRATRDPAFAFDAESLKQFPHDYTTTDAEGNFSFPPQANAYFLLVATDKGYVFSHSRKDRNSNTLTLRPWSSIRGTLALHDQPAAGITVEVQTGYFHFDAITDHAGKFSFTRLPAGDYALVSDVHSQFGKPAITHVKLRAGQVLPVILP